EQLKDRGIGADAERERQYRDGCESGIEPQQPRAVPHVAPRAVEKADRVHLIDLLANLGRVAELPPRRGARRFRRHAARDVLVDADRERRVELACALVVPACAAEKAREAHSWCSATRGSSREARRAGM